MSKPKNKPQVKNEVNDEQGQELAGEKSGEASGSDHPGAAQESEQSDASIEKDPGQDPESKKEKVFKMKLNVFHNKREFPKDAPVSEDDKDFKELFEKGFLE